jgi:hypothetical protein
MGSGQGGAADPCREHALHAHVTEGGWWEGVVKVNPHTHTLRVYTLHAHPRTPAIPTPDPRPPFPPHAHRIMVVLPSPGRPTTSSDLIGPPKLGRPTAQPPPPPAPSPCPAPAPAASLASLWAHCSSSGRAVSCRTSVRMRDSPGTWRPTRYVRPYTRRVLGSSMRLILRARARAWEEGGARRCAQEGVGRVGIQGRHQTGATAGSVLCRTRGSVTTGPGAASQCLAARRAHQTGTSGWGSEAHPTCAATAAGSCARRCQTGTQSRPPRRWLHRPTRGPPPHPSPPSPRRHHRPGCRPRPAWRRRAAAGRRTCLPAGVGVDGGHGGRHK